MSLNLGDRFTSFSGFEGALEIFQAETDSSFFISDSKTLETYSKRNPGGRCQKAPKILKYYTVKYNCKHGGRFYKYKNSRGLRNTSTQKFGCEAFIYVTLAEDAKALVISSLYLEHNHDVNVKLFTNKRNLNKKTQRLMAKIKDLEDIKQERYKNKEKYLVRKKISQKTEETEISASVTQDLTNLNPSYVGEGVQISYLDETGMLHNPAKNISYSLPEGTGLESGEPNLCRCGIGTWELTKQDLMLMEVEEHNHRLEILQLQEAYQIERMEKTRYLQDLKIRKAEKELLEEKL